MDEDFNPYEILQLPCTASQQDIKKSYHNLILCYHPDRNNPDVSPIECQEKFHLITKAWEMLNDESKRCCYDKSIQMDTTTIENSEIIDQSSFTCSNNRYIFTCRCGGIYEVS
jgi:DnaJ-class molecular chaperone